MTTRSLAMSLPLGDAGPRATIELARQAEAWGYEAAWAAEVQGPDAISQLGALAATTRLELGVAVLPVQTRAAFVLAMTALTLDDLSHGRFTLGVGSSSETVVTDWAGQPFEAPYTHVAESLEILRPLLAGERVRFEGQRVRVPRYRAHTVPERPVPLYVGALGPRMLRLAGRAADGVCLNQLAPHHVPEMRKQVEEGAAAAGRSLDGFGVVARVFCAVTDRVALAREAIRHQFGPYVATSVYNSYYRRLGYEAEAEAVLEAAHRRDRAGMSAALSDRVVDDLFMVGDAADVAAGVRAYVDAGVTTVVVAPVAERIAPSADTLQGVARHWHAA